MKYSADESDEEPRNLKKLKQRKDSDSIDISEGDLLDAEMESDAPDVSRTAVPVKKVDAFRPSGIQSAAAKKEAPRKSAPVPDRKKDKP